MRQLHQVAAKGPCKPRQPIDHDKRSADERGLHGGRAAGHHAHARVHQGGAGIVAKGNVRCDSIRYAALVPQFLAVCDLITRPARIQRARHRHHVLELRPQALRGADDGRQVQAQLLAAAAGQQCNPLLAGIKAPARGKVLTSNVWRRQFAERVADELGLHAMLQVELAFKGEDDQHLAHILLHLSDATPPPRPQLRADVINHGNTTPVQFAGQPQIPVGEVNQHGHVRAAAVHLIQQPMEAAVEGWQVAEDLEESDDGNVLGLHQQLASGGLHALAAHAVAFHGAVMQPAQGGQQLRAVKLAGGLARADEHAQGARYGGLGRDCHLRR